MNCSTAFFVKIEFNSRGVAQLEQGSLEVKVDRRPKSVSCLGSLVQSKSGNATLSETARREFAWLFVR